MKIVHHLKSLFYFAEVARHLSIKQAAAELYVTQAAVSQQLRLLEDALGVSLFRRIHRGIELTSEGQQLLPVAASAFSSLQRAVNSVADDADPSVLTVSILPSFASRWLIPRLGDFYQQNPDLKVMFLTTERLESFAERGVDLAVRFGRGQWADLESRWLMDDVMYPVCHPHCPGADQLKQPQDLAHCQLLVDSAPDINWEQWFEKYGVDIDLPNYSSAYDGAHYIVESALAGQGVGLLRHSLVAELITHGSLIKPFAQVEPLNMGYYLCAPAHHFQRPKVQRFGQWLEAKMKEFRETNPF